jgi:hypothetical protein
MLFSYFPYAAAFIPPEGEPGPYIDPGLVGIALALAPLVFVAVGFISRNPEAPKKILQAMGALIVLGLSIGLLSPVLGAAAGFGTGIALTLNQPEVEAQMRRRLIAVALVVVYMLAMLVFIPPGGVLAGAVLPGLSVGFADEYGAWRYARTADN